MREQSLRVCWRDFADACERLIEWRSFALWVRAIVDTERQLPEWLKERINYRCPGFLSARQNAVDSDSTWLDLSAWIDDKFFAAARDGGWLDALHYYSGRDRRSEQVWRQWEQAESTWRHCKQEAYPAFEEWFQEALKDFRPAADEETAQSTPIGDRLSALVPQYIEWEAFAFWVRSIVESARGLPAHTAGVLEQRCPGFLDQIRGNSASHAEYSTWVWRDLVAWIEAHIFADAKDASWLDAVRDAARSHLRAERIAAFWAVCSSQWGRKPPDSYPTFEQWLRDADAFVTSSFSG